MLYVVGAALPKTDFLTKIDIVIVLTTISLAFTGLASLLRATVHRDAGKEVAERWNKIVETLLIGGVYFLANMLIFGPACFVQRRAMDQLAGYGNRLQPDTTGTENPIPQGPSAESDSNEELPATLQAGNNYITWTDLMQTTVKVKKTV